MIALLECQMSVTTCLRHNTDIGQTLDRREKQYRARHA